MGRSETWIRYHFTTNRILRFAIAFWLLVWVLGFQSTLAQSPASLIQLPRNTSHGLFLVNTSVPYDLPTSRDSSFQSLSATQIGQLAAERCGPANTVSSDLRVRATTSRSSRNQSDCETTILNSFQSAIAFRLRQTAAANAIKLHYGIAACIKANSVLNETHKLLQQQDLIQAQLVDKGIPIPDPLLIGRLLISLEDKRLENNSKLAILRAQLAALIGPENACGHTPNEFDEIVPSDCNVCEHTEQALACRCDLLTMKRLRGTINADSLEVWNNIGALLSGAPSLVRPNFCWSRILRTKRSLSETQSSIAGRRKWLDELIAERTKQIVMEVEVAFEKKKTAALRWVKSNEQIENWQQRIHQLEKMSDVQGNMAGQFEARLNVLETKGQRIERWVEWHLANVELLLSIGCEL